MKVKEIKKYQGLLNWWWTILIAIFGLCVYLHGMHKKRQLHAGLIAKAAVLEKQLYAAIEKREDLLLQIESQSDLAWTEMLIKKHLGMVPLTQKKVYFEQE